MPWIINKIKHQQAESRGKLAEHYAAGWLRLKGYRIIMQRFRCQYGEIDIIARKKYDLIAVEVKYRQLLNTALYSITFQQRQRIQRSLLYFQTLDAKNARFQLRFDVVCVYGLKLQHLKNAW